MSDIIARLRRYTGQDRRDVANPCITAREAIEIANHIHALEQPCSCDLVVSLRREIESLKNENKQLRSIVPVVVDLDWIQEQ